MRGKGVRNVVAENVWASQPYSAAMHKANRRKMCWQCQKDKPTLGGHLDIKSGLHKFVCADCMATKKAKNEVPTVQSTD